MYELKVECDRGHKFTEENTYHRADGWRRCRTCNRDRKRLDRAKSRAEAKAPKTRVAPVPVILTRRLPDGADWRSYGLCGQTDPEAFTPEKGGSNKSAKAICSRCEVREVCLQYALAHNETDGVWGGLSPRERRKLRLAA